jgi:hypothetical protein
VVTKTELALAQRAVPRVRDLVRHFGTDEWGWAITWWAAFFACLRLDSGPEWEEARADLWSPGHPRPDPARVRAARTHLLRDGRRPQIDRALGAVSEDHIGRLSDLYVELLREDVARLTAATEASQRALGVYEAGGHPDPEDVAAAKAADPHARIPDVLFAALDLVSVERQVEGLRKFG